MNQELQNLLDGYLDDQLSSKELERLKVLLKEHPVHAQQAAQAFLLHDRLYTEVRAESQTNEPIVDAIVPTRMPTHRRRWIAPALAAVMAFLFVGLLLWQGDTTSKASAAVVALDRMIEAAGEPVDRVYRILVTDPGPDGPEPAVPSGGQGRKPGIDGATLYVRGSDQFVLVRRFGDGTDFITGSDGQIGWAAAPTGHVHLSRDTRRFRRAVPGEHEELPFIDLKASFSALRRGYDLELKDLPLPQIGTTAERELVAMKRSANRPGPELVRIAFDSDGVARRIELSGLPPDEIRARGVALELIEQRDLGPDFFKHETHHDVNRPTDWE
jgi:hypothetical protein